MIMTTNDPAASQLQPEERSGAAKMFGDFAPGLVAFTDDVLFGEVWARPGLSPRDRSLVTVGALTTAGVSHGRRAGKCSATTDHAAPGDDNVRRHLS
jgi:alkylhydroperoxidase/carboxymuconolactone decarboxylase family protein YurZ